MKNKLLKSTVLFVLLFTALETHGASLIYDANVTPDVLYGSGNANGGFTVDQVSDVGIEVGLRTHLRFDASGQPQNVFNSNGDGTYSYDAGVAPTKSAPVGVWSVDWSINSDYLGSTGNSLNDFNYLLSVDIDPTQGQSFLSSDPINVAYWDHSIGDNSTGNGLGTEAVNPLDYTLLIDMYNVAQNSFQPQWLNPGFDPTLDATWSYKLEVFDGDRKLASTSIDVIVGAGGAPVPTQSVPDSGQTLALLSFGFVGLVFMKRKLA